MENTSCLQGLLRPVCPQSCDHLSPCAHNSTTVKFEGPWFTTQLTISVTIGVTSFLLFSYCRTRWPLLFAPRTKLKGWSSLIVTLHGLIWFMLGFSPHEAHAHQAFFGWIMPTIRTSEFTVLQIVGLDAAVVSTTPHLIKCVLISARSSSISSRCHSISFPFAPCSLSEFSCQ